MARLGEESERNLKKRQEDRGEEKRRQVRDFSRLFESMLNKQILDPKFVILNSYFAHAVSFSK